MSAKSSYFRIKSRPSIALYGKKGMFLQQKKDPQEEYLKRFRLPGEAGFGLYDSQDYGLLTLVGGGRRQRPRGAGDAGSRGLRRLLRRAL